jgi:hypothetical protein
MGTRFSSIGATFRRPHGLVRHQPLDPAPVLPCPRRTWTRGTALKVPGASSLGIAGNPL